MLNTLQALLLEYQSVVGLIAVLSLLMLMISILATPWLIARLPREYLVSNQPPPARHFLLQGVLSVVRGVIGTTLVLLGLLLLVLPGPGIVTLLLGISITPFPGKRRLVQFVASRDTVFNALNRMRQRHGSQPFIKPDR